jgi:DNA-binding CsgD family transcriptional regulator
MTGVDEESLQALIGEAYDAALDPGRWQIVLDHLADACRSGVGFYIQGPGGSTAVLGHAGAERLTPDPGGIWHSKIAPWRSRLARAPEGMIMPISTMTASPTLDERGSHQSARDNELMVPREAYYGLAGVLRRDGPIETTIAVCRSPRIGDYTASELKLVERLMPHLRRAVAMHRSLVEIKLERQALLHSLDGLGIGIVLAAGDGLVLFADGVAGLILRSGDGLSTRQGRLHAATPSLTNMLLRYVKDAVQPGAERRQEGAGALSLPRRAGDKLHLLVCPFPVEARSVMGPTMPSAIIFINAPSESLAVRQEELRAFYDLSAAEAKLVGALLTGVSVGDYADRNGISLTTVKTQLRNVFAKTGQNRQADLVRHILSNPVARLASQAPVLGHASGYGVARKEF